jgi:hypothetical protein
MQSPQELALEDFQRAATMLSEIEPLASTPGVEGLAQYESQLGQVAILLKTMAEAVATGGAAPPKGNTLLRQKLQEIRITGGKLKAQFDHGSNFYMGLLQAQLGTGYSEQGLPVLAPNQTRSSFEG